MILVSDTLARSGLVGAILGRFPVMAMSMKQLEVHQPIIATKATRDDVVDFRQISRFEIQPAECTASLLELEQVPCPCVCQGMLFQPFCEVK